eukprot:995227-Ditylum_brightwellii.AAC.1
MKTILSGRKKDTKTHVSPRQGRNSKAEGQKGRKQQRKLKSDARQRRGKVGGGAFQKAPQSPKKRDKKSKKRIQRGKG